MARKKKNDAVVFEVKKPPSDITFIPPDSILEPYPRWVRFDEYYFDIVDKKFKEYILRRKEQKRRHYNHII